MIHAIFNRAAHRSTLLLLASAYLFQLAAHASESKPNRLSTAELAALKAQLDESPNDAALLFEIGDAYYKLGADGDKAAVDKACEFLERLLNTDPDHARALVTLGSVFTLKARDAALPPGKLKWARKGIETMDRAVAMDPDSFEVRWIRATNNFHMPKFMKRQNVALADLRWLWSQCQQEGSKALDTFKKQRVGRFLGMALEREGERAEAQRVWRAAKEWAPSSQEGAAIQRQLEAAQ